ncbi:MAG: hypothetical protein R3F30_02525 [Planctomycetota bacterium]
MNAVLLASTPLVLLLPCQDPTPKPRAPEPGCRISVPLVADRGDPADAKRFGLVLGSDRAGMRRFEVLDVQDGKLAWDVPARACDGTRLTWYLVRGLSDKEQVGEFWKDPTRWRWGRVDVEAQKGKQLDGYVAWVSEDPVLLGSGILEEADGGAPRDPRFSVTVKERYQLVQARMNWHLSSNAVLYDPWSGRFWVQGVDLDTDGKGAQVWCTVETTGSFPDLPGSATEQRVELDPGEGLRIRLRPTAALIARIDPGGFTQLDRFQFYLWSESGKDCSYGTVHDSGSGPRAWFDRLPEGSYRLECRSPSSGAADWSREGIRVKAGEVMELPVAIPLDEVARRIEFQVTDASGQPVRSGQIRVVYHYLTPNPDGSRSTSSGGKRFQPDGDGRLVFEVPARGSRFVVIVPGHEPVVIDETNEDHKVRLQRQHTGKTALEVALAGIDEEPQLKQDLWVLLEPVADVPVWASQHCFGGVMDLRRARVDKDGLARFEGLPAEGFRIRLTYGDEEGSWKVPEDISQRVLFCQERAKTTLPVNANRLRESHATWQRLLEGRRKREEAASRGSSGSGRE